MVRRRNEMVSVMQRTDAVCLLLLHVEGRVLSCSLNLLLLLGLVVKISDFNFNNRYVSTSSRYLKTGRCRLDSSLIIESGSLHYSPQSLHRVCGGGTREKTKHHQIRKSPQRWRTGQPSHTHTLTHNFNIRPNFNPERIIQISCSTCILFILYPLS
jgi:hypothetical protein